MSDTGIKLRGRRCTEVEQTFGQIKWNKKFKRFLLKGVAKVSIEIGLVAIAHNLQKLNVLMKSGEITDFLRLIMSCFYNFLQKIAVELLIPELYKKIKVCCY